MTKFTDPDVIARRMYRYDSLHTPIASPDALTDEHVEQYRRVGFVAVENVFSSDEVADAQSAISFLINGGKPDFDGIQFENGVHVTSMSLEQREAQMRKLMWFVDHDPRLKRMSEHPKLLALVERMVGAKVGMIQDMALLKPPRIGREKPWHQDAAYFLYEPLEGIIGTWTALDDATVENGCMHVIPGSHLGGPRAHYHERDCQLADDAVEVERDVMVPLKSGGVMLFSGLLHHGTPPNRSTARRRALQFHYAAEHCRRIDAERHKQMFRDDAGYGGCAAPR